jgi:hypothetical protein
VRDGLRGEGFIKPGVEIPTELLRDFLSPFIEPARTESFRFSREWMRTQAARVNDPRKEGFSTSLKINLPPSYLLIHRVWIGSIGVLCQLGAESSFRSICEESLPGFAD